MIRIQRLVPPLSFTVPYKCLLWHPDRYYTLKTPYFVHLPPYRRTGKTPPRQESKIRPQRYTNWLWLLQMSSCISGKHGQQGSSFRAQSSFLFYLLIYLLIYLWLRWVFVAARGLSLVAASWGYSLLQCTGFSLRWLLLVWSMGSKHMGSIVVARGL